MKLLASLVGVFFIFIGIASVARPAGLMAMGYYIVTPIGLYVVAALRIGIGLVLVVAASASRAPNTLRILGTIIFVAGLVTPFVGVDRTRAMLDWWTAQGPVFIRLSSCVAIAIGAFITYVVAARRRGV